MILATKTKFADDAEPGLEAFEYGMTEHIAAFADVLISTVQVFNDAYEDMMAGVAGSLEGDQE
jgi:hypothetical protein